VALGGNPDEPEPPPAVLRVRSDLSGFRRLEIVGSMISGAKNRVHLRVESLSDLIIMKAHAKAETNQRTFTTSVTVSMSIRVASPHYDLGPRQGDSLVNTAIRILREKFETVNHYGPQQLMVFHDSANAEERVIYARRAYELVQKLLSLI
jgi:hypothetical protein